MHSAEPQHTFLFADLAGFTALTEAHGDEEAAELAETFCARIRTLLPDHDAEEVKEIGDAMMIRGEAPGRAIELGLRIVHEIGRRHGFPAVRVGMHTGTAVERSGDWFGASVNLAARVAGAAGGCEVLLTERTRDGAGELQGIAFRDRGPERFKNVAEAVRLYVAHPDSERAPDGLPIDPVCHMAVDPERTAGVLVHEGVEYHFCSLDCAGRFIQDPAAFATSSS